MADQMAELRSAAYVSFPKPTCVVRLLIMNARQGAPGIQENPGTVPGRREQIVRSTMRQGETFQATGSHASIFLVGRNSRGPRTSGSDFLEVDWTPITPKARSFSYSTPKSDDPAEVRCTRCALPKNHLFSLALSIYDLSPDKSGRAHAW
jgi:hypothetical protein